MAGGGGCGENLARRQHADALSMALAEPEAAAFAAQLRAWRVSRGLSQAALAKEIMYSRSLVNLVENGYRRTTAAFALAADAALDAGGLLHAVRTTSLAAGTALVARAVTDRRPAGIVAVRCARPRPDRMFIAGSMNIVYCSAGRGPLDLPQRRCGVRRLGAANPAFASGTRPCPGACTAPTPSVLAAMPSK